MRNNVTVKLKDYSGYDGSGSPQTVLVLSHPLHSDRVIVKIGDSEAVVIATDLAAAIRSATQE